ncbi:head-tail joining protein [Roseococcus pinisoli]|uniref:Uncharacterized protein n=1 Tax=Roseococcus pinisoli TaxID=2835040 RepID=A0ABS5Q9Z4_9PROT|nr:hypothetical protein [Roseococcus pinisoli]MBS7810531.1 hypothetical protein [Roseococcus pinisoli]
MTAFARAAAALHADPNLSSEAIYTPVAGQPVPVRVIRSSPIEGMGEFRPSTARREEASIPAAAVPGGPRKGASLTVGGEAFLIEEVTLDPEGTAYTLVLSRD